MKEDDTDKLYELADLVHAVARHLPAPTNLEPGPCTPVEIGVMRFVGRNPGVSAREAAHACRMPSSNFSRVLGGLVQRGLLERRPDKKDGRVVHLHPTTLSRENARRMRQAWSAALRGAALDEATVTAVAEALSRIEAHLASNPTTAEAVAPRAPNGTWTAIIPKGDLSMLDDLNFAKGSDVRGPSIRGLYGTPTAPLPFLGGVVVRAFVLERPQGNIIIYNAPGIGESATEIRALGQPDRLLLNHHHEAMYGTPDLEMPIWIHERDRPMADMPITDTFSERHMIDDDLEVIPTPGHTPGTTMFLWDNGEHRLLFPGDSLWVQGGAWKAVLLGDSNRSAYLDSLALLREVEFDILVPWGVEDDAPYGYEVSREEATRNLEKIMARLRRGENA